MIRPVVKIGASIVPDGVMTSAYNADLTVTGGTGLYTVTVLSGSLPAGLSTTGTSITGTPTDTGNFSFTLQITEAGGAASVKSYSMKVHRALSLRTKNLRKGRTGKNYVQRLRAGGGKKNYAWTISAGALPAGLSLDPATGKITGTPAAGVANFTIQVTDSLGATAQQAFSITVN